MKLGRLLLVLGLAASVMPALPAEASCQTSFCYHQRDELGRQREVKLKQRLFEDASNRHDWQALLSLLDDKYRREKSLAAFNARLHWEPQPILERPDVYRSRYEAEAAQWRQAYRQAFPEPEDQARLEAKEPLHALERQAAHFPENFDSQKALLKAYQQQGRDDHREVLFEELWERFPSVENRRSLCWAVGSSSGNYPRDHRQRVDCFVRLLDDSAPASPAQEEILDGARQAVWMDHYHQNDWAALQRMSSTFSSTGKLLSSWSSIASDREEHSRNCVELRKFFDAGGFNRVLEESWDAPSEVRSLAGILAVCDREADGEKLLRAWLPDQPDKMLRWPRGYPEVYRVEIDRRLAKDPDNRELLQALLRMNPNPQDRIEIRDRLAALPLDDPRDVKPLLALAHELRGQDRLKAAARVMTEAVERRPEDADLLIRAGLAALEAKDRHGVRALARRVLRQTNSSPRQRAEAGYLLGRVDLREGRFDSAVEHFDHYFSLRVRFEGCPGWETCDLAFQLLLVHLNDVDRLRDYQARRAEGIEAFQDQIEDRFFPGVAPSHDMLVICPELPCRRWPLARVEDQFTGRDSSLLALAQRLRQTDW